MVNRSPSYVTQTKHGVYYFQVRVDKQTAKSAYDQVVFGDERKKQSFSYY